MSWNVRMVGRDKEKLKAAIRAEQCKDEERSPHNGAPSRVVDFLCKEVDRVRVYEWPERKYAIHIEASGSFHEQGVTEHIEVKLTQVVE